jgi:uncharacterized protein YecT (DUF1311 family)
MKKYLIFLMFLAYFLSLDTSGQKLTDDCDGLNSRKNMDQCYKIVYKRADKELNELYQVIHAKLKAKRDSTNVNNFINEQRIWLKFRDASCRFAQGLGNKGHEASLYFILCLINETEDRNQTFLAYKKNPAIY